MGKKVDFDYSSNCVFCWISDKEYEGVGIAKFNEFGIEEKANVRVGESIAYSKAKRDIIKQKMNQKKKEIKILDIFVKYLFPKKYEGRCDWVRDRANKKLNQLKASLQELENEKRDIDESIVEYLAARKAFLQRLKKKKESRAQDDSDVTNEM